MYDKKYQEKWWDERELIRCVKPASLQLSNLFLKIVYLLKLTGLSGSKMPFWTSTSLLARMDIFRSRATPKLRIILMTEKLRFFGSNSHFDVVSNFSLFFFLRHFQGLKFFPSALSLLLRSWGGDREHELRLLTLTTAPFCCFLTEKIEYKHF